jgi:hypothetical protein
LGRDGVTGAVGARRQIGKRDQRQHAYGDT